MQPQDQFLSYGKTWESFHAVINFFVIGYRWIGVDDNIIKHIMCNKSYIMLRICTIEKGSGIMNRQNSFSSENDNFASEKSIGIQMSTSPKTIATVHEFHLHYSDFYDCGFKSLVMVAFVNGFFNPESRKIFVKEGYFVIFIEKKIAHCIGVW